jgi:hypothetical protein
MIAYISSNGDHKTNCRLAGYKSKDRQATWIIAQHVLARYCAAQADHKKIFAHAGLTKVKIPLILADMGYLSP